MIDEIDAHWDLSETMQSQRPRMWNFVFHKNLFANKAEAILFYSALIYFSKSALPATRQVKHLRDFFAEKCPVTAGHYGTAQTIRQAGIVEPMLSVMANKGHAAVFPNGTTIPSSVFDLGRASGVVTSGLASAWDLSPENAVSLDLFDPPSIPSNITFRRLSTNGIPTEFDGRQFDLAIASLVLHHMQSPGEVLEQLSNRLVPGGYLLIREHNKDDESMKCFLDTMHVLYEVVFPKQPMPLPNACNYHPMSYWLRQAERFGLSEVSLEYKAYPVERGNTSQNFLAMLRKSA
jgi:SAM-dependent methyltransferase